MNEPNYSRQILKYFSTHYGDNENYKEICGLLRKSEKIMLPHNGRLINDKQFRGIDEFIEMRLPFPIITMEYSRSSTVEIRKYPYTSSKVCILAREQDTNIGPYITFISISWIDSLRKWIAYPEVGIPRINFLSRGSVDSDGNVGIMFNNPNHGVVPDTDYADEAGAIIDMISALSCSNIVIEKYHSKPHSTNKGILPFDSYYVLTIKDSQPFKVGESMDDRRRPREHVRRGHIRRSENRKIWVNATVINRGIGAKISKDYSLRVV